MVCDKCGKNLTFEDKEGKKYSFSAIHMSISNKNNDDSSESAIKSQLGEYYDTSLQNDGVYVWDFCYECVLNNLFGIRPNFPVSF